MSPAMRTKTFSGSVLSSAFASHHVTIGTPVPLCGLILGIAHARNQYLPLSSNTSCQFPLHPRSCGFTNGTPILFASFLASRNR